MSSSTVDVLVWAGGDAEGGKVAETPGEDAPALGLGLPFTVSDLQLDWDDGASRHQLLQGTVFHHSHL